MEWLLLSALLIKHIIADYYIQMNFMFKDKHIYGSTGGMAHSATHGWLTAICFVPFVNVYTAIVFGLLDFMLHYHIDYVKSNYSIRNPMQPTEQRYWIVHGTDQLLHVLTYILCVWLFVEQAIQITA